jgi:integrase
VNHEQDNKFDNSQSPPKPKKRRAVRGNPQPYLDGKRWKAPGYYRDLEGNQKCVTGTGSTQRAAIARKEQLIKQRLAEQQQSRIPDGATTVGAYCRFWLEKVKQPQNPVAYKTYQDYESVLRNWIEPKFGKMPLGQLKRVHIIGLFEDIRAAGKSRTLQIQVKSVLSPALKYALAEGHVTQNPFIGINLMKTQVKAPVFFEFDQASRIMLAAKLLNEELKWDLAISYGLRQGERLGLVWGDLDLNSGLPHLTITKQLQRQKGKGLMRVQVKTSASVRTLPLTEYTVELLKSQKAAYDLSRAIHGESWNPNGYILWNSNGKPFDPTIDRKHWVKLLALANVPFQVGHTARKTAATLIEDADIAFQIMGQAGHSVFIKHYRASRDPSKLREVGKMQQKMQEGWGLSDTSKN